MWTKTQDTSSLLVSVLFSFPTLIVGILVCYSILTSRKKLRNAYRRIIFVMTMFDLFISIGGITTPFRATPEISQSNIALGNHTSAVIFTAIMSIGIVGSQMYNVSLSVYYLYLIKYNYRERKFRTVVEPFVHAIPILWTLIGVISCLATQSFNPASNTYFIAPYPRGCRSNDEIECTRGGAAPILALLFGTVTMFGTLIANILVLIWIWRHVYTQEQRANRIRIRRVSVNIQNSIQLRATGTAKSSKTTRKSGEEVGGVLAEALAARNSRNNASAKNMSRRFLYRAALYTIAFIVCYGTNFVVQLMIIAGTNPKSIPFGVRLWARIIRPLQGFFNILIFTYPHTKGKMKDEPELSYVSALVKVIRSGCDNDDSENMSNRRNGLNNSTLRNTRKFGNSKKRQVRRTFGDDLTTSNSKKRIVCDSNDDAKDDSTSLNNGKRISKDVLEENEDELQKQSFVEIDDKHLESIA